MNNKQDEMYILIANAAEEEGACRWYRVMGSSVEGSCLSPAAVVVGTAGLAQPRDNVGLDKVGLGVVGIDLDAVVVQDLLDLAGLDADAGLAHDLCVLADPDDKDELDARGLGVVGVLDAGVAVLGLGVVKLVGQLRETSLAGGQQAQNTLLAGQVADEQPVDGLLVGADGVVGGADGRVLEATHCVESEMGWKGAERETKKQRKRKQWCGGVLSELCEEGRDDAEAERFTMTSGGSQRRSSQQWGRC